MTAPPDEEQAVELATVFQALGDQVRLRLLSMIASREGGEIRVRDPSPAFALPADDLPPPQAAAAGRALDCERRGTWVYRWPLPGTIDKLAGMLTRPGRPALPGGIAWSTPATAPVAARPSCVVRRRGRRLFLPSLVAGFMPGPALMFAGPAGVPHRPGHRQRS